MEAGGEIVRAFVFWFLIAVLIFWVMLSIEHGRSAGKWIKKTINKFFKGTKGKESEKHE